MLSGQTQGGSRQLKPPWSMVQPHVGGRAGVGLLVDVAEIPHPGWFCLLALGRV